MIFWQKIDFVQNYFLVFLPNYASHDFDSSVQKVFKLILLTFFFKKKKITTYSKFFYRIFCNERLMTINKNIFLHLNSIRKSLKITI